MWESDFGLYLRKRYPHTSEAEAMERLLAEHGSLRGIARAIKVSLVTISRWGRRLKVTPPPQFVHLRVTRPLLVEKGVGAKDRLLRLKKEKGTWRKVAVHLQVTEKELQRYRYMIGLVPKEKFKQRCEGGRRA
jgi:hypothetical protein